MSEETTIPNREPAPPTLFNSLGFPAPHFRDADQQKEAATLGMWLFLGTEVLLFGGLFTGYFVYRHAYPEAWEFGSRKLYAIIGAVNTAVLLTSSLCVALAVHAAHAGDRTRVVRFLLLTIGFGAAFLGIKGYEYSKDYAEHLVPWSATFDPLPAGKATADEHIPARVRDDPRQLAAFARGVRLFMLFYFVMTLLHATHMVAGVGALAVLTWLAHRGRFSAGFYTPVEMAGLYWHFVDVVWVFLLPALYFVRPYPH